MDLVPAGEDRTEVSDVLPPELERRLVLRLLAYWRALPRDGGWPPLAAVVSDDIGDMWPYCFVATCDGTAWQFRNVGPAIAATAAGTIAGQPISAAAADTLLGVAVSGVKEMLRCGVPYCWGGETTSADGVRSLYRSILLPLSEDGVSITGFLGAANCRTVAEG